MLWIKNTFLAVSFVFACTLLFAPNYIIPQQQKVPATKISTTPRSSSMDLQYISFEEKRPAKAANTSSNFGITSLSAAYDAEMYKLTNSLDRFGEDARESMFGRGNDALYFGHSVKHDKYYGFSFDEEDSESGGYFSWIMKFLPF